MKVMERVERQANTRKKVGGHSLNMRIGVQNLAAVNTFILR